MCNPEKKSKNRPKQLTYFKSPELPKTFTFNKYSQIANNMIETISEDIEKENVLYENYDGEVISVDSEWTSQNEVISLQIYIPKYDAKIIVLNSDLRSINPTIYDENVVSYRNTHVVCNALYQFSFKKVDHSALVFALQNYYTKIKKEYPKKILLLLFYSVKDLVFCFGPDVLKNPMLNGNSRRPRFCC